MQNTFLLIIGTREHHWRKVIEEALSPLGTLDAIIETEIDSILPQHRHDVLIVDAVTVSDASRLVAHLRARHPEAKIVVVTASPTWHQAREAFRAGATDYFPKSSNKEELFSSFKDVLKGSLVSKPNPDQQGGHKNG